MDAFLSIVFALTVVDWVFIGIYLLCIPFVIWFYIDLLAGTGKVTGMDYFMFIVVILMGPLALLSFLIANIVVRGGAIKQTVLLKVSGTDIGKKIIVWNITRKLKKTNTKWVNPLERAVQKRHKVLMGRKHGKRNP